MKKFFYLSVVLLSVSGENFAVEDAIPKAPVSVAISINVLVQEAMMNNPELAFYRAEITAAKGDLKTSETKSNPDADFEIGRKQTSPKLSNLSDEGMAWSVSIAQTFEWPSRLTLRKAIANRQIDLATIGLARFQRELQNEIQRAAFNLLIAQEKRDATLSVAQRGEELIQALLQRESAGTSPLLETRIIEANILTLKRRANEAAKLAEVALFEVNRLRGKPIATPLSIAPARLRFPVLEHQEELIGLARTNSFEIKSQVLELGQQGLKVDLAKNERYPAFKLRTFYSQEDASEREQKAGVGVSVPLPLWNRNKGNIDAAKSRFEQAQASLTLTQRNIEKQLHENLAHYAIDQKEISRWQKNVLEHLRDAAELADRHYRLGSVPLGTYLEMQEKYLEGMEAVLETQAEALAALKNIERLTGMPLGNVIAPEATTPQ